MSAEVEQTVVTLSAAKMDEVGGKLMYTGNTLDHGCVVFCL